MARTKRPIASKCLWSEDDEGNWDTACGEKHQFVDGTPSQNHYRFCPYCGLKTKEALYSPYIGSQPGEVPND